MEKRKWSADKVSPQTRRPWTEKEMEFIRENYQKYSATELSKMLNRSFYSVRHMIFQLGVRKRLNACKKDRIAIKPIKIWGPSDSFIVTVNFVHDFELVHKKKPRCHICGTEIKPGMCVRWTGKGDHKKLVCEVKCHGKLPSVGG